MAATILITGANGFIGSHATLLLESLGHRVLPLDLFPRSPDLSLLGIKTPSVIMDVTDGPGFRSFCAHEKPTHIFHAAHPKRDEAPEVLNFCCRALTNILESAKELKAHRVVYASSGALYGQLRKIDHSSIKEDDPVTIYPTYFYRSAKIVSEWLGAFYQDQHGVSFVALRFSSVYGPGLGRGIPLALKKGILGQACHPYLTRLPDDLIYVDDVVNAIELALFADRDLSRAYNIASDKAYDNADLKRAIQKALPELLFEIGKHPNAALVGAHRDRDVLDIGRAKKELDWSPKVGLEEGVARLATWLMNHRAALER
jgi:nucleoside-diphosphate-sugar epimerase